MTSKRPDRPKTPKLLAPAGNVESFHAALENGADSVYLGLKRLSARASAANFSPDELSRLMPYARKRGAQVFVAFNSLIAANEFPEVLDLLQTLSDLAPDALIVQDPAVFYLARRWFPGLRLHASTLTAVHNSAGVEAVARMGASRAVLARELSLDEIRAVAGESPIELEAFVHGALCFSYSGLCLTSSFRGGHGGLQGRCVQPCRLRFRQGKQEGFFLSCNDLCALPLLPELKRSGLASLKIEGRMKQADYVARVVSAYRRVLDAPPPKETEAVQEALEWLQEMPQRRLTSGFFAEKPDAEVLTPHRSGSSGIWVGTVKQVSGNRITLSLRRELRTGDRLRAEAKQGREKSGFTVGRMFSDPEGEKIDRALPESRVVIVGEGPFEAGERVFRVGGKTLSAARIWRKVNGAVSEPCSYRKMFGEPDAVLEELSERAVSPRRGEETLLIKVGWARDLAAAFQSPAQWVALKAIKPNLEKQARQKLSPPHAKRFIWSLPSLIEQKDVDYYGKAVAWFVGRGYRRWEINNWGHLALFPRTAEVTLSAGYRMNLRNAPAIAALAEAGCTAAALSLEITREELHALQNQPLAIPPAVTVYAWPPLFVSRLQTDLRTDKPFVTTRKEDAYHLRREKGFSLIYPDRPINWFGQLGALRSMGYRNFVIDLSEGPFDPMKSFERILSGFKRERPDEPYSLFNWDRRAVPEERGSKGRVAG
jgi:putative protease